MANEQFGFNVKLEVDTGDGTLRLYSYAFEIHFTVEFSDEATPGQTTIDIYNLNQTTINRFKKDQQITLTAGFGNDMGVVTHGKIKYIHPPISDGGDNMLELVCFEGTDYSKDNREFTDETEKLKSNQIQVSFTAGVSARYVLETLSRRANIGVQIVSLRNDKHYDEAYSASGKPIDCMEEVAKYAESSLYYRRGELIVRDINTGYDEYFTLRGSSGLLAYPAREEDDDWEGYSVRSIFNHRFATASIIDINSRYVKGRFRVKSGSHTYDGISAETNLEVQEEK